VMSVKQLGANYNRRHNETRQLRPHNDSGAFLPDKGAWLRYWRLYRWWRRCSEKNNCPTPMERLCNGRRPIPKQQGYRTQREREVGRSAKVKRYRGRMVQLRQGQRMQGGVTREWQERDQIILLVFALTFAQRALCAAAIFARDFADILRLRVGFPSVYFFSRFSD
jgi:hypothetical protein